MGLEDHLNLRMQMINNEQNGTVILKSDNFRCHLFDA